MKTFNFNSSVVTSHRNSAKVDLAHMYREGIGVNKNPQQAIHYYELCEQKEEEQCPVRK